MTASRTLNGTSMNRASLPGSLQPAFWPLPGLLVLTIAVVRAVTRLVDLDLQIAGYAVSSPLGYLWLHLNPALASIDWPAGSADFRFSAPMQGLLAFVQVAGISPESTVLPFAFAQIVLMLMAFGYLAHVLFGNSATTVALTALAAVSPIAGINLANFGSGLGNSSPVLFYMWAHGFKFLALAFFLRERMFLAAFMAALAVLSHLMIGAFMVIFIATCMLVDLRRFLTWKTLAAIVLFAATVSPLAWLITDSAHVATGEISRDDWVLMSRLFNWHWHPIELGLFGPLAALGLLPILLLALGYLMSRRHVSALGRRTDAMLLAGIASTVVLSIVGILFSEVWPTPVLMKPALQRSSEIASLILLAYLVRDLVNRIEVGPLPLVFVACWGLLLMLLASPGIALAPILILGLVDAIRDRNTLRTIGWGLLAIVTLCLAAIESLPHIAPALSGSFGTWASGFVARLWTPAQFLSPFGRPDYTLIGGIVSVSWFAVAVIVAALAVTILRGTLPGAPFRKTAPFAFMALSVLSIGALHHHQWSTWAALQRPRLVAFKEAQLWAASHTPPTALFLGDPARANGWREYSGRAYYGALAELSHFATLYDSAPGLFEKGLNRVREFGVDPLAVDRAAITIPGGKYGISVLGPQVSASFNKMKTEDFKGIASRHGVTHLIVERAQRASPLSGLTPVFANSHFDIYDLGGTTDPLHLPTQHTQK